MDAVFEVFTEREMQKAGNGIQVFRQESGMDENERQAFLENFREGTHETVLGFCVLGGIFSEGIDLKSRSADRSHRGWDRTAGSGQRTGTVEGIF